MKQITIDISPDGTKSEVKPGAGYSGPSCIADTAAVEAALGGAAERKLEKAFYEVAPAAGVSQGQK